MRINSIQITHFKSIYDTLRLDFDNIKGLWKISGPVGSGKTTIGEAIIYGLFGTVSGKNNTDLLSWGQTKGQVELWCASRGRNIYIKRQLSAYGQSPIYAEIDGEELVFTNKRNAQMQLETEYYDTSKVTLELLCIISFNNFKSLASLNTSDTKKFLDQVLGFYVLTQYSSICKEFEIETNNKVTEYTNKFSDISSQIDKIHELNNKAKIEGNINEVKDNIKSISQSLSKYNSLLLTETQECKDELTKTSGLKASVIALGKNKANEIKFIEQGKCPTCGAPIDQSQLAYKKQEREALMNSYNQYCEEEKRIKAQIEEIQNQYTPEITNLTEHKRELERLLIQLQEQERRIHINTDEIDNLERDKETYTNYINEFKAESSEWSALNDILTSEVRAKILESFIPVLNGNILKYTQKLQQPYIIEFDSNFKCNVSICGMNKQISISSLSTGQLKTVDMIIILGILGTIIGSNGINIIFLDELFSNLDSNLRNEMCRVLRETLKQDDTIFIISHQDMDSRYFDGEIHMKLEQKNQYEKHSVAEVKTI